MKKASVVSLALSVLAQRRRSGRTPSSPREFRKFLRLKLSGRCSELCCVV